MVFFGLDASEVFKFSNFVVLPAWLLLMIIPKLKITKVLVKFTALILSIDYFILLVMTITKTTNLNDVNDVLDMFKNFNTKHLQEFASTFSSPNVQNVINGFKPDTGFLLGWIHFLALDLLLGHQISLESHRAGFSWVAIIPLIMLTIVCPPIGFIVFTVSKLLKLYILGNEEIEE
eukprot:gene7269-11587_t